ncbi:MAG: hydroxyacylglutathione hydrolase [Myxococcales bacterium]|nr:hydroxyacylglutathione hydrolase [Myxococcota bacterium]MDW8282869.1 hydroxyacylglutathione hydrolase [Myxococcales bacterium]
MRVLAVPCLSDNYAYLVVPDGQDTALVVDPSEAGPVLAALQRHGLRLGAILCTHHHWDHVGGNEALCAHLGPLPVFGHRSDLDRGRIPAQTHGLVDGERCAVLGLIVQILHIPGHTLGAVAYYIEPPGVVFTGDTLFLAGCGRLFEGTPAMMHTSLSRLAALPGETRVYCGHEYTLRNLEFAAVVEPDNHEIRWRRSRVQQLRDAGQPSVPGTMAEELRTNPFLRVEQPQVRRAACQREPALPLDAGPAEVLGVIRRWKDAY